jgi:protein-L-isoaspartate(D-aspartate) O-methyltransferase
MNSAIPFESERRAMVERQLRRRGFRDVRVLEAMLAVPRHEFVRPEFAAQAYEDRPLPIGEAETISQPYMVAAMTAAARIEPGDHALEVGAGSGYQAAILSHLGARVVAIERNPTLADEARSRLARLGYRDVEVFAGDGSRGYLARAPFNAIIVSAAAPKPPQALLDQLADGGRLVIPIGGLRQQILQAIFKHQGQLAVRDLDPCQFVPLIGEFGWPAGKVAG